VPPAAGGMEGRNLALADSLDAKGIEFSTAACGATEERGRVELEAAKSVLDGDQTSARRYLPLGRARRRSSGWREDCGTDDASLRLEADAVPVVDRAGRLVVAEAEVLALQSV
jgi:hypothetical protein